MSAARSHGLTPHLRPRASCHCCTHPGQRDSRGSSGRDTHDARGCARRAQRFRWVSSLSARNSRPRAGRRPRRRAPRPATRVTTVPTSERASRASNHVRLASPLATAKRGKCNLESSAAIATAPKRQGWLDVDVLAGPSRSPGGFPIPGPSRSGRPRTRTRTLLLSRRRA
jgi:hypothetical protein